MPAMIADDILAEAVAKIAAIEGICRVRVIQ